MPGSPLQIVVDTREQRPYLFEDDAGITVTRAGLLAGDYSLVGYEGRIAIERKSLDDLVQTVIGNSDRFYNELRKLDNYQDAAVVVEASLSDITGQKYKSGVKWQAVLGAVFTIQSQFKLPILFAGDRIHAALAVRGMLLAFRKKVAA